MLFNYGSSMRKLALLLFIMLFSLSCGESGDNSAISKTTEVAPIDSGMVSKDLPLIRYKKVFLRKTTTRDSILRAYSRDTNNYTARGALMLLNRKELRFMRKGDSIVVPETFMEDTRAYSAFPHYYPQAQDIPKLILVSNAYQCYACYERGVLVRFAAANTGKESTPTYPGRYSLVYRKLKAKSSIDSNWILPFTWSFHAQAGNAFHEFSMPGRPVSHSCVRQFQHDAKWLYHWGEGYRRGQDGKVARMSGTPVVIIDVFDFSRKRGGPWAELTDNKPVILRLPENPLEVEEALIPICQIPKESRGGLVNLQRYINAEDTLRARGVIRAGTKLRETVNFNKIRRDRARRALEARLKNQNPAPDLRAKQNGKD